MIDGYCHCVAALPNIIQQHLSTKAMTPINISTETLQNISSFAEQFNLSLNDFFEQIIQGKLAIVDAGELEDLLDVRDAIAAETDPENIERIPLDIVKQELGL